MKHELLAWRKHPEPNGTDYFAKDLNDKSKVIVLFDFCQILEAIIFDKGWCFLFKTYGLKGILEIDTKSGWMDDEDLGEWIGSIYYNALIAGFEPGRMEFGKYSGEDGIFTNEHGQKREIDWKEIYHLKDQIDIN